MNDQIRTTAENPGEEKTAFSSGNQYPPRDPAPYRQDYVQYQQAPHVYPPYGQPYAPYPPAQDETVSLGEWIWSLIVTSLPFVGIIFTLIFAFGDAKPSKKNFFRARLILAVAATVLAVIVTVVLVAVLAGIDTPDHGGVFDTSESPGAALIFSGIKELLK